MQTYQSQNFGPLDQALQALELLEGTAQKHPSSKAGIIRNPHLSYDYCCKYKNIY